MPYLPNTVPRATFTISYPRYLRHKHRQSYGLGRSSGEHALQRWPHEGQGEEQGDAVEQGVDFPRPAAGELYQHIGDEPEAYAVGDVEGQRECQDGQEGRDGLVEAVPRDEPDGGHHQEADHYKGRGRDGGDKDVPVLRAGDGHGAAEDRDQGRERQREQEQQPDDDAGQTRPTALGDPRPALYVTRHGARTRRAA